MTETPDAPAPTPEEAAAQRAADIAATIKIITATEEPTITRPRPDPTQGARSGVVGAQLGKADAARMSPAEIVAARKAGLFDDLLAGRTR